MTYQLRDYQQAAVAAVLAHIRKRTTSCLLDLATGAGKSLVAANIAMEIERLSGKKTLVLAPSKELVEQNFEKYEAYGNRASFFSAAVGIKSTRHNVVFGTPKTVLNSIDQFKAGFAAVVIDEANQTSPTMRQIVGEMRSANPNLRVIGMTATPYRLGEGYIYQINPDGSTVPPEQLTDKAFFAKLVYRVSTRELINRGYLTPPEFYSAGVHYAAGGLQNNSRGKFDSAEVAEVFEGKGRLTADIVADAVGRSQPGLGVMFFAASISHAMEICESLPSHMTELVTGETPKKERTRILSDFKAGKLRYLVNVAVLTTGFDAPNVGTVAILRATESPGLLLQIIGRGLRLHDGKYKVMILDYAENLERHAPAGDVFDPEIRAKSTSEAERIPVVCPCCGHTNMFALKPNDDGWEIDADGYFVSTLGERIINDAGEPVAAHFGQRCQNIIETATTSERCSHRWDSRACPECGGENSLSARECIHCAQELVDPNDKLSLKRAKQEAKERDKEAWHTDNVVGWSARKTENATAIDYHLDGGKVVTEYLCPGHAKRWVSVKAKRRCIQLGINWGGDIAHQVNHGRLSTHPTSLTYRRQNGSNFFEVKH